MQTVVDLLKELYTYNQHVNRKLIQFFQQHHFSDDKVFRLFSHILNAHHIWLSRIEQQPAQYEDMIRLLLIIYFTKEKRNEDIFF